MITSVSPSAWFADRSYDVTIAGTNFLTASDADGPTKLTATENSGSVEVSNVVVVSATEITAAVKASKDSPAGMATVTATNGSVSSASGTYQQPILPQPVLYWPSQSSSPISGDDASVQNADAGQPINLTTNVSPPATLPGGIAISSNTWTVGGTNVGNYTATTGAPSAAVIPTKANQATLSTFWLYPNSGVGVKYQYCVDVPDLENPCSDWAKATFDVKGATATITANPTSWTVPPTIYNCPWGTTQVLYFGFPNPISGCGFTPLTKGITFNANLSVSDTVNGNGTTAWVQIIEKNTLSGRDLSGNPAAPLNGGTGLDNSFPYAPDDPNAPQTVQASDSPHTDLDPNLSREARLFGAAMYYLWQPQVTGAIWVPLAYVEWSATGTANQNTKASPPWFLLSSSQTATPYVCSETAKPKCSLPTWTPATTAHNSPGIGQADEDNAEEEEQ